MSFMINSNFVVYLKYKKLESCGKMFSPNHLCELAKRELGIFRDDHIRLVPDEQCVIACRSRGLRSAKQIDNLLFYSFSETKCVKLTTLQNWMYKFLSENNKTNVALVQNKPCSIVN